MIGVRRLRGARHARLQLALAAAAIAAAVALPTVLVSVGGGVEAHEIADLQGSGYQIVVNAAGLHGIEYAHSWVARLLGLAGVTAASPTLSIPVDAENATGAVAPVLAEGIVPREFTATLGPTDAALFPDPLPLGDPNDTAHTANGSYRGPSTDDLLVSTPFAAAYGVSVGSVLDLGLTANLSGAVPFEVTGTFGVPLQLLQPTGAFAVLLPLSDLQTLAGYANGSGTIVPDAADSIAVATTPSVASDPAALAGVAAEIQALAGYYSVGTLSQQAQQIASAGAVLTGFYLALSSVGIGVGVLFLALVLVRRVEADRRAIGIRRALGLPPRRIVGGIILDGARLGLLGALLGVAGGIAVVSGLARWGSSTVQEAARLAVYAPLLLGEIVAGVVGLAVLAGAVAGRTALRTPIAEALR